MHDANGQAPARRLSRRDLLQSGIAVGVAIAGAPLLVSCETINYDEEMAALAPTNWSLTYSQAPQVDVHCHIFNFRDIPAANFAKKVLIGDTGLADVAGPLIDLVEFVFKLLTPSVPDEFKKLRDFPNGLGAGATTPPNRPQQQDKLAEFLVTNYPKADVPRPKGGAFPKTFGEMTRIAGSDNLTDWQRFYALMATPVPPRRSLAPDTRTFDAAGAKSVAGSVLPAAGAGGSIEDPGTCSKSMARDVQHAVAWVFKLTQYRYEHLQELRRLLPTPGERARLLTPSLLDYDFWLSKTPESDHAEETVAAQVQVMKAISKVATDGVAVHAFVPFDPLRDAWERYKGGTASYDTMRDAIEQHGCIGVKVYPPMGYLPMGNTKLKDDFGPNISPKIQATFGPNLGKAIDESLKRLYKYCTDNDVPVFTHCSNSQGAFDGAALRSEPDFWRPVLDGYGEEESGFEWEGNPNLRINLGHAGGPWCLADPPTPREARNCNVKPGEPRGWFEQSIAMAADPRYSNVYFDIADYDLFMECQADKRIQSSVAAIIEILKVYKRRGTLPRVLSRMMYGTDWLLLGRAPFAEYYYLRMREHLIEKLGAEFGDHLVDDFFSANALRYLGLTKPFATRRHPRDVCTEPAKTPCVTGTWDRLTKFYEKNGRPGMLEKLGLLN